jgi:hypothetical protein
MINASPTRLSGAPVCPELHKRDIIGPLPLGW